MNKCVLLFVLAVAGYFDLRYRRIPNWWIAAGAAAGFGLSLAAGVPGGGVSGALWAAGGFLVRMGAAFAMFFGLFLFRMIGAGDIKLTALICGYLDGWQGVLASGGGFIIGACFSLAKMIRHRNLWSRLSYLSAYIKRFYHTRIITPYYDPARDGEEAVIPLGLCLFLGALLHILVSGGF